MEDIVFYQDTSGVSKEVGRLKSDCSWTGEKELYDDVMYVAQKNSLNLQMFEGRQMLIKLYSGAYLWAAKEREDTSKK